jgi:hypothetical protein
MHEAEITGTDVALAREYWSETAKKPALSKGLPSSAHVCMARVFLTGTQPTVRIQKPLHLLSSHDLVGFSVLLGLSPPRQSEYP